MLAFSSAVFFFFGQRGEVEVLSQDVRHSVEGRDSGPVRQPQILSTKTAEQAR